MSVVGTVKFFNDEKGFGFVETAEHGDVFVHRNQCVGGQPQQGDAVSFDVEMGRQGKPQAVNCTGGSAPLGSYGGGMGGGGMGGGGGGKGFGGPAPPCRQFQQGNCSYGERCRFSHT
mmetsp:Transcript_103287/g.277443  ORF Transcript_103287/g.277443 Transcript_103287/m.277443 type:complete len:117 (+) Transcript_103287:179-529(+)